MFFQYKSNLEPGTLTTPRSTTGCWWIELLWLRLILIWIQPFKRKTPLSGKYVNAFSLQLLPPATKFGQGYVFTGICHSVNRGEYLTPPRPGADTPQDLEQTPPGTRYTPLRTDTPWDQVHPLGQGTPPWTRYITPQDQVHPPRTRYTALDQVHPPGPGTPLGTRYTPWDQVHPWTRYPTPSTRYSPPGPDTPPRPGTPPLPMQSMLGDTVN